MGRPRGGGSGSYGLRRRSGSSVLNPMLYNTGMELMMECSEDVLSPSQIEATRKAKEEYKNAQKKIEEAKAEAARLACAAKVAAERQASAARAEAARVEAARAEAQKQAAEAAAAAANLARQISSAGNSGSTSPDIMIVGESPPRAGQRILPLRQGQGSQPKPVSGPIINSVTGRLPASMAGVPQEIYRFANHGQNNNATFPQQNQWLLRPLQPGMQVVARPVQSPGGSRQPGTPTSQSLLTTIVSGTSGLGIKRSVGMPQEVTVTPPSKKIRGRFVNDSPNSGNGGSWVPLDEYYYGKMEGDPTFLEDKGEFRFRCWICTKMLYNNVKAMVHLQGHIDSEKQQNLDLNNLTQCKHCYKQFDTPFEMQTHIEKVHLSNMNVLMCRICEKDHESRQQLTTHMRQNHCACEMPYTCQLCHFRSSMYSDVVDHFKKKHDSSDSMLCLYCLRVFHVKFVSQGWGQTQVYYHHLLRHQSKTTNRKCTFCKLSFFNAQDMKAHRKAHHVPNQKGVIGVNVKQSTPDQVMIKVGESGVLGSNSKSGGGPKSLNAPAVSKVLEHRGLRMPPELACSRCFECNMRMNTSEHYKKYIQCSMCRFATSCSFAYATHMMGFHSGQLSALSGSVPSDRPLPAPFHCLCGFFSTFGNQIANHLVYCSKRTGYLNKPELPVVADRLGPDETDPRHKPDASILDVLGLVKKPIIVNTSVEGEEGASSTTLDVPNIPGKDDKTQITSVIDVEKVKSPPLEQDEKMKKVASPPLTDIFSEFSKVEIDVSDSDPVMEDSSPTHNRLSLEEEEEVPEQSQHVEEEEEKVPEQSQHEEEEKVPEQSLDVEEEEKVPEQSQHVEEEKVPDQSQHVEEEEVPDQSQHVEEEEKVPEQSLDVEEEEKVPEQSLDMEQEEEKVPEQSQHEEEEKVPEQSLDVEEGGSVNMEKSTATAASERAVSDTDRQQQEDSAAPQAADLLAPETEDTAAAPDVEDAAASKAEDITSPEKEDIGAQEVEDIASPQTGDCAALEKETSAAPEAEDMAVSEEENGETLKVEDDRMVEDGDTSVTEDKPEENSDASKAEDTAGAEEELLEKGDEPQTEDRGAMEAEDGAPWQAEDPVTAEAKSHHSQRDWEQAGDAQQAASSAAVVQPQEEASCGDLPPGDESMDVDQGLSSTTQAEAEEGRAAVTDGGDFGSTATEPQQEKSVEEEDLLGSEEAMEEDEDRSAQDQMATLEPSGAEVSPGESGTAPEGAGGGDQPAFGEQMEITQEEQQRAAVGEQPEPEEAPTAEGENEKRAQEEKKKTESEDAAQKEEEQEAAYDAQAEDQEGESTAGQEEDGEENMAHNNGTDLHQGDTKTDHQDSPSKERKPEDEGTNTDDSREDRAKEGSWGDASSATSQPEDSAEVGGTGDAGSRHADRAEWKPVWPARGQRGARPTAPSSLPTPQPEEENPAFRQDHSSHRDKREENPWPASSADKGRGSSGSSHHPHRPYSSSTSSSTSERDRQHSRDYDHRDRSYDRNRDYSDHRDYRRDGNHHDRSRGYYNRHGQYDRHEGGRYDNQHSRYPQGGYQQQGGYGSNDRHYNQNRQANNRGGQNRQGYNDRNYNRGYY